VINLLSIVLFLLDHITYILSYFILIANCLLFILRYFVIIVGQASSSSTLCHTGVSQGSVSGPIIFSCYISPISFIANTFGVGIQQYADDTQLYISLTLTDMHA